MSSTPNDTDFEIERIAKAICVYLEHNARYHNRNRTSSHSWPCMVWDKFPSQDAPMDQLRLHGLLPKNWLVIKRILHDKETLGDSEGNQ